MLDNKELLIKLLNELLYIMGINKQWSFHTLTLKINENFNKDDLKKAFDTYTRWLKKELENNHIQLTDILYISAYEISKEMHLHLHLLLNHPITEDFKKKLIKNWNEYNGWPWYNNKGLLIKNDIEYNAAVIELLGLDYKLKSEGKENLLENVWIILNYMTKDLLDMLKVIKLNYIIYPLYIINGSMYQNKHLDIVIKALQNLYKQNIYNVLSAKKELENRLNNLNYLLLKEDELVNPLIVSIPDIEKLSYVYGIWKKNFVLPKKEKNLIELFAKLIKEKDLLKKQELIEGYIIHKENIVNELKLYDTNSNKDYKTIKDLLELKLNKKIEDIREYKWVLNLELKENAIYYIFETFVKLIRYYKFDNKIDTITNIELENLEFAYTEFYFKTIIRELYIINILLRELKEYKLLYEKNKLWLNETDLSTELKSFIEDGSRKVKDFYKDYHKEIEISIAKWVDLLLEILYEMKFIIFMEEASKLYIKDKTQRYFTLSKEFLKYLLNEEFTYLIVPPLLVKPKAFQIEEEKIVGGYHYISNILFSENENLEYRISKDLLDIVNQSQMYSLSINDKYLNYILNSSTVKVQHLTSLNFTYYIKHYITGDITEMKKAHDMFRLYEFFLTLYVAEFYKKQDFWFISKLDQRGRKYDVGYPLNFYRDKYLRNLFIWNRSNTLKSIELPLIDKALNYKTYLSYIENIHKEDEYNIFNIIESPHECLVGFDAKNQIYQIIGGLLRNIKLLELSKVIETDSNSFKNIDIYTYFLKRLKNSLNKNIEFLELLERINYVIIRDKKLSNNNVSFGLIEILEMLDRKWIKDILMTYGYNKSIIRLVSTTDDYLYKKIYHKFNKLSFLRRIIKKITPIIINTLIKDFNKEIKELSNLKIIFNSLISISKLIKSSVKITIDNKNSFNQYYLKIETVTFQYWRKVIAEDTKKGYFWKKITVNYPKIEQEYKKLDFKKGLNALLPNTCHYIDSLLMYNVIKSIIELDIPIKTIHDSFYTNIKYKIEITNIYRQEYIKIFKDNPLLEIVKNALDEFLLNEKFFSLIYELNKLFNQMIPYTDIHDWKFPSSKQLKKLNLDADQKTLYKCLLTLHKNYLVIWSNELMQKDFEEYCKEYKNDQIIL